MPSPAPTSAAIPLAPTGTPPQGGRRGGFLGRIRWWQVLLVILAAPVVAVFCFYGLWAGTFDISHLNEMPQRAIVYDMNGADYSRLNYGANRISVHLNEVSPLFVKALVAREDSRFYSHRGVDPRGIARAIVRNVTRHRAAEGASTLTQQLARNSLPLGGKTFNRKILEAFVAMRIERHYTKDQILEFYINRIFYGAGLYGVETASQAYFGKPSAKLDLSESAMMAGLIRSPNRFSPLKNLPGATIERNTVLGRMTTLGMISGEQAKSAEAENIHVAPESRPTTNQDNYAMAAVRHELDSLLSDEQTDEGGLKIYTTIDPTLQKLATDTIDVQLTKIENRPGYEHPKKGQNAGRDDSAGTDYLQGALVLIDNHDGAIRALVGGREYKPMAFNRATDPPGRPVGSTFKPFVYTAAWQRGLLPGASIDDGPIHPGEIKETPNWNPSNSDGTFGGVQPAEVGLIRSRNTMSIRVGELIGLDAVRKVAHDIGLGDIPAADPTVFLGTFNTRLKDLTEAYTLFPNSGVHHPAYMIERIDDVDGQTIYRAAHGRNQLLQPGAAWITHTVLEKVMQKGTGAEAKSLGFAKPCAGKTGTTNDFKDAWFVGYTTSLTCGVWVGLDRPQTIMAKGYGAALALPIWCQVMAKAAAAQYPATTFQPPEPLRRVRVCSRSNQLATAGCETSGTAYSIDLPLSRVPAAACTYHQGALLSQDGEPLVPGETPLPGVTPAARSDSFPSRFMRSVGRFFGGK